MLNVWGGRGLLKRGHWNTSKDGELHFVKESRGGELYSFPRKNYTRTHPYPLFQIIDEKIVHIRHINPLPREKSAIIKLRNLGYPIHHLAKALGRSTSFIHETLRNAKLLGLLKDRLYDQRKCPRKTRLLGTRRKLNSLLFYIKLWESWILGEGDEPP